MNFDYKLLGNKLKEARESLLMEITEVAEYLNCTSEEYQKIESGDIKIEGDSLVLLSKLYMRDFRYFVTGNYHSAESQMKELFRRNNDLSKHDRIAIQSFIRLCEQKQFFEECLGLIKALPVNYSNLKLGTNNFKSQGKRVAPMERQRLGFSDLSSRNIYSILRKQHIHIFRRKLDDDNISGIYIRHPKAGHCILINYSDDIYRQNFSLAHEYGHVLFDSDTEQSISYQKGNSYSEPVEWRANSFASHFLLPDEEFSNFPHPSSYDEWKNVILEICHKYAVSSQVVVIRLSELELIDNSLKKSLSNDRGLVIPKNGKNDPEIMGVSKNLKNILTEIIKNGLSLEYIKLCRSVYQNGLVSYGKVIESLQLSYESGKEIVDSWNIFLEV